MSRKSVAAIAPKIVSSFTKENSEGKMETFYIVVLDRINRVKEGFDDHFIDFMMEQYVNKEAIHLCAGISKSKEAIAEYREIWKKKLSDPNRHTLVCYRDDTDKPFIIGASSVKLVGKDDSWYETIPIKTPEIKLIFEIRAIQAKKFRIEDLCQKYGVDSFYYGQSLVVHPAYYFHGIPFQMGLSWLALCKQYLTNDIEVMAVWTTSSRSQAIMAKYGMEAFDEINVDDISKQLNVTFPEDTPPSFKLYYYVVSQNTTRSKY